MKVGLKRNLGVDLKIQLVGQEKIQKMEVDQEVVVIKVDLRVSQMMTQKVKNHLFRRHLTTRL